MSVNVKVNLDDKEAKQKLQQLQDGKYNIKMDVNAQNIKNTSQSMNTLTSSTKKTMSAFDRLKAGIKDTFSTGKLAMTGYLMVMNELRKAGKQSIEVIEDVDQAITDLSIASGMTREATAGLVKDYNNYAKELKATTTQITSAADDYLRAGKTMSQAKELIKDSIMLSKLGQISSSESTEDLLATMNGYNMSVEEVSKALDAMVAIDFKAATSSGDLATGLKYSASSAASAEVSFNKLVAILGTVQDRTQQSAEVVGTFANTMLSRYRDVTIGKYLSDDGDDISNYEAVLKSVGIQLRDQQGEFRDFETVLQEMADKWNGLTSVQQNALIKVAAGTRQQNRFIALMENYNKVLELTEVAANSAGTAVDKFNNSYANSLEAKKNTLQASFESMIVNSDMSEVYSGIIEATTDLVNFINATNALKGAMTALSVAGFIKGFAAVRTGINEAYISLNQFQNAYEISKRSYISDYSFGRLLTLSNGLSDSQMKLILSSKSLTNAQREQILVNAGLSTEEAKLKLETWGMTTANNGLTVATTSLKNAALGLWNTLLANPLLIVTAAVSATVMAYNSYKQKLEETRQANISASDSASELANNLTEAYEKYVKLSNITERTTEEEDEYKQVIEDITGLLGDRTQALQGLSTGTEEYTAKLKELTKAELLEQQTLAVEGRKSAEEEFSNAIFSQMKGSKVSIDSNSKGKSLSDETQKAVDIVSDSLKEFETVNRTWDNLSWDISSGDPEEAVKYYNALVEARQKLIEASKADSDEALLDTEIHNDLNNAINAMSDKMDTYISKKYEELKLDYMIQNGIPTTTEEYQKMGEAIRSLAGDNEAMQNSVMDLFAQEFPDGVNTTSEVVSGLNDSIENLEDTVTDLDVLRTQINGTSDDTTNLADELKLVQEVLRSTGQISEETYTKLLSCSSKYSAAVKTENGRLTINKSKLKATAIMRSNETKKTIQQVKAQKQLEYLKKAKELNIYNNTLLDTTSETYDNVTALQNQITQLSMLTEQLNTATDAFQNFKDAQSSDDLDMYNTSSDAFKTIKDALESGQVGSDDMRAAMELLMSQDQYKEFLKAGHSEENALEKQYLFMEKWADTNKKFFGDDMKQNAINFFEYLDKTGLLADGVLATSEEIGKQTGLSVDAVNSLIQFGNMYGFQDIIQQSQIDYVDDYVEKMQNLQSAKEAFQQANESDPNSNITLGLKDDLSNAQKELDDFYADIPKKFNDISEEYMNTTTDKSLGEYFTEQMGGDDNTLAYMQSIGDRLKYIDQEKNRLSVQNKDKGIFSTSQYKALEDEESVLKSIQEQLETSNDTYQKAIANTDEYVKLVAKKKNIQKAMNQSGSDSEIKQLSGELSEVQGQLDALSAPTQIQLSLDKSEVESEIQSVTSQIERLTSMSNNISLKINKGDTSAGAYQALNAINNAKNTAQNQKADLQGKLADIETTIKYVADTTEIDAAKDSIPDNTDSNVTFKVNGLSELERARNIMSQLQSKTIDINIRANTAGVSAANWGKNGMSSDVPIAHAEGTAHADGNWGLKKDENGSLVGELGTEGLVRDGKFYLIGANGAQFMNLKKNDIIFNHKQVAKLQRNGHINSRGKAVKSAYVNGTLVGTAHSDNVNNKWHTPYIKNGADTIEQNPALKKAKDEMDKAIEDTTDEAKDKSEEVFDWIERKVKKLQRLFERWTNNAEKTLSASFVGKYYNTASKNLNKQLDTQEKAYSRYLAEAEKSPISDIYKKKIKDGAIDIETIIEEAADNGDKTLADHINNYQTYYDKATDALSSFEEAAEKKFSIPLDKATKKVELFKNQIDLLDKKIDNAIGAKNKNKLIDKQIKQQKSTLKAYKDAQKSTKKNVKTQSSNMTASSVLKSSDVSKAEKKSIKKNVKNGKELDLTMFQEGSKAYLQAVKYNEAIRANTQATLDYKNAVEEYTSAVREAAKTKFDNIATDFENKITLLEHKVTNIDNQISNIEARGLTAGKSYYASQKQINADQLAYYKKEKASLENYIANIEEGTEDWYDAKSKIQECANSIATCEQNVYKLNDSIRNVDITKFELIEKQISAISDEADFLNGLIGNDPLFDEDKVMTNAGLATLGNYAVQYYSSKSNASNDKAEIERLQKILNDGTWASNNFNSAKQVQDRIDELYGTWQGNINDLNSAQKSIYDLMNQELDNQLDKIKELIEAKKEELEAEKDLHDYQNTISEKTKDIATLQKQIAAYSGNTSQEGQAKLQKLQTSLNDKQKDLRDTEYDKYISDQEDILDKLLKELEEANKKQLNDFMKLVQEGLNLANSNIDTVNKTIQEYSQLYGYKPQYLDTAFSGKKGSIQEKIDEVITAIKAKANESVVEPISETPTIAKVPENAKNTNGTPKNDGISQPVVGGNNNPASKLLETVKKKTNEIQDIVKTDKTVATNYINSKAKKRKDKKSDIKYDVNKRLWDVNSKKTLTTAQLKELAKKLGVTDTKFDKSGALYKKLHSLKVLGFANGGIVRDELEGKIKKNGDSLLASINPNETVLTEKFTNLMPDAVDMMSKFVKVDIPDVSKFITPISQPTTIDSHIDINLPNVENGVDFIAELKKPKVQKALQSVTTDLLAGGSKLGINRFK